MFNHLLIPFTVTYLQVVSFCFLLLILSLLFHAFRCLLVIDLFRVTAILRSTWTVSQVLLLVFQKRDLGMVPKTADIMGPNVTCMF